MEKRWFNSYPAGTPHEINPDQYSSLVDLFEKSCQQFSDRTAYINMGNKLSYAKLDKQSKNVAAYLQKCGLSKGARVAIMMPNSLQYPVALFGILRAGCIVVNVNPLYTEKELTHQLNDSGAEAIFIIANFAHILERALPNVKVKHIIVTELGDLFSPFKRGLVNFVVKHVKKMVPKWSIPKAVTFRDMLQQGEQAKFTPIKVNGDDAAFLQYTGGTTGIPKGAELTHRNMVANVLQCDAWFPHDLAAPAEILITALPLYHIFALTANCLLFLKRGAENLLITNPRDIPTFIKELKSVKFNVLFGVNTLFNALLNHPKFSSLDFSGLTITVGGGMDVQYAVAEQWQDVTGTTLLQGYGLTESSPVVSVNPVNSKTFNGSIGLPLPSTDVSIRDAQTNQELDLGDVGELCIKGPQVMRGYWQRPKETKEVITADGWLKTGDMARIDRQGFVYITGRIKEMIIVSGFNVYPSEVEDVIIKHPDVVEVGVAGVPDGKSGEVVKAYIVKSNSDLTEEAIIEYCRKDLTGYKVPKHVSFVKELPKTNVGKVLRLALKDLD